MDPTIDDTKLIERMKVKKQAVTFPLPLCFGLSTSCDAEWCLIELLCVEKSKLTEIEGLYGGMDD